MKKMQTNFILLGALIFCFMFVNFKIVLAEEQKTSKEDYRQVLNTFIEKTKFIDENPEYNPVLSSASSALSKKSFLEAEGNTEEKWEGMTKYERFCYKALYDKPKGYITDTNNNFHVESESELLAEVDDDYAGFVGKATDGDKVLSAISEAWEWHWENWKKDGIFINLLDGTEFSNAIESSQPQEEIVVSKEDLKEAGLTDNEIKEIEQALDEGEAIVSDSGSARKELASTNNFLSIVKENVITIAILIVALIALAVIIIRKKNTNY